LLGERGSPVCAINQVATNGAKPPKIITDMLKANATSTARLSTGNCSRNTEGSTPL
jgi:hypothetical protein